MQPRKRLNSSGIRQALRGRLGDALNALKAKTPPGDERIHLARRALRRTRAGLRLWRELAGKTAYRKENSALRDAARIFAPVRDAKAAVDTTDHVLAREKSPSRRMVLEKLRRKFKQVLATQRRELDAANAIPECIAMITASRSRISRRRAGGEDPVAINPAVKRVCRRGRAALAAVDADGSDGNLHELRKQVKFLAHILEILPPRSSRLKRQIMRAKSVATWLGDDHDLAMLQARIRATAVTPQPALQVLLEDIWRRRRRLQGRALKQSRAILRK